MSLPHLPMPKYPDDSQRIGLDQWLALPGDSPFGCQDFAPFITRARVLIVHYTDPAPPLDGTRSRKKLKRNQLRSNQHTSKAILRFREPLLARADESSRSTRSCRWARRASAASVSTTGSAAAHRRQPDPGSANRRRGLNETHALFTACRHPAVRQCPRGCVPCIRF